MDIFEIVGKFSLQGADKAKKDIDDVADAGEKSSSKLDKLGSIAKTVGKGMLVATGAAVTGSVALVKSISSSYGELQQSIGGVETLFGDSAQTVIENANNAYTTAGISANEYMQQVTSFTASLLQSLDGDTEKAAAAGDMAVRDMADNANKFGSSMESIQNAYQGFSKQNYTMLDNLKLGYGGTKEEMKRLLEDAEKISGIKYDISSLSDVYSAIHVIQQELGVTGTTALEGAETIEGSFNSLGAAWQNFMAGLGNPEADMKRLVDNLSNSLGAAINNVIPIIENIVKVLPDVMDSVINAVGQMVPTLIETFTTLITKVIDAIVELLPEVIPLALDCVLTVAQAIIENLPLIIDAGIQLIQGLIDGIASAVPTLIPTIIIVLLQIVDTLLSNIDKILEAGLQFMEGFMEGLLQAIPLIVEKLPTIINGIIDFFVQAIPMIIEMGIRLLTALVDALPEIIQAIVQAIPEIITGIVVGLAECTGSLIEAGIQLFAALITNLPEIIAQIVIAIPQIIAGICDGFYQSFATIAGMGAELGTQIGIGIANWWQNTMIPFFTETLPGFIEQVKEDVSRKVSEGFEALVQFFADLPENIGYWTGFTVGKVADFGVDLGTKAIEAGRNFINNIVTFFKELPGKIASFLRTTITHVVNFAITFPEKAKNAALNFLNNLVNGIRTLPAKIWATLSSVISKVAQFARELPAKALQAARDMFNAIVNTLRTLPQTIANIGLNIVQGLWNGISGALGWLKNQITGFANSVVSGFKAGFGVHSPSRLLRDEVGVYLTQGLGEGIEADDSAEKAIKSKVDSVLGIASDGMSDVSIGANINGIVGESPMQKYQLDFNAQMESLSDGFERLLNLVGQYLPNIAGNMDREIVLNGDSLAVGMSRSMDYQLGKIASSKARGNV